MLAARRSDDNETGFWIWLAIFAFFIIKRVIEAVKGDKKEESAADDDDDFAPVPSPQPRRRIREIMMEMNIPRPQKAQDRQDEQARRAAQTPAPTMARRAPVPAAPGAVVASPSPAVQPAPDMLSSCANAAQAARDSLNLMSDAEQAALQRLRSREAGAAAPAPAEEAGSKASPSLKKGLRQARSLKTAILYQEILGRPRALQGSSFRQ